MTTRGESGPPAPPTDVGKPTALSARLGSELLAALKRRGMSQADLARTMGLSEKHISHMVNGKSGGWAMFDYAAFTLGVEWNVALVEPCAHRYPNGPNGAGFHPNQCLDCGHWKGPQT